LNRTAPNDTLLLANHAGRGARMPDVCSRPTPPHTGLTGADQETVFVTPFIPPPDTRGGRPSLEFARRQYQNTFESAYGLLPRPLQTPAARFKRLYRK